MRSVFTAMVVIILMTPITSAIVIDSDEEFEELTVELGRTILIEERTANWCPTCASIDPELEDVADSHGARVAIVGLHTSDAFENDASRERINYQNQTNDGNYGTPTFFVDSDLTAEGYDAWSDVQKRILTQENSRTKAEPMSFTITEGEVITETPAYGQISIMLLEHGKIVPAGGDDNPGEKTRDRVLIAMTVIYSNGSISQYEDMSSFPQSWSIVIVHEPIDGGEPYGVVEVAYREIGDLEDSMLLWIIIGSLLIGGLMIFIPTQKPRKTEEE